MRRSIGEAVVGAQRGAADPGSRSPAADSRGALGRREQGPIIGPRDHASEAAAAPRLAAVPRAPEVARAAAAPEPRPKRLRGVGVSEAVALPGPATAPLAHESSRAAAAPKAAVAPAKLAQRIACGRTNQARLSLAQTRLFQFDPLDDADPIKDSPPAPIRGLQATRCGSPVYILDMFTRCRVPHADVAPILPSSNEGRFALGRVQSVRISELSDARFEYALQVTSGAKGVSLRKRESDETPDACPGLGPTVLSCLHRHVQASAGPQATQTYSYVCINS